MVTAPEVYIPSSSQVWAGRSQGKASWNKGLWAGWIPDGVGVGSWTLGHSPAKGTFLSTDQLDTGRWTHLDSRAVTREGPLCLSQENQFWIPLNPGGADLGCPLALRWTLPAPKLGRAKQTHFR